MTPEQLDKLLSDDKPAPKKRKRYTKPEAVKKLEEVVWEHRQQRIKDNEHSMPYPVKEKFTDKDANGLTKCILAYVNMCSRSFAYRVNNTGIFDEKTGKRRSSNTIKGIADITACVRGQFVQIEVKHGRDRMSEGQKRFRDRVHGASGVYLVARDFTGFVQDFKKLFVS